MAPGRDGKISPTASPDPRYQKRTIQEQREHHARSIYAAQAWPSFFNKFGRTEDETKKDEMVDWFMKLLNSSQKKNLKSDYESPDPLMEQMEEIITDHAYRSLDYNPRDLLEDEGEEQAQESSGIQNEGGDEEEKKKQGEARRAFLKKFECRFQFRCSRPDGDGGAGAGAGTTA